MTIQYDHSQNLHTVNGPQAALPVLLAGHKIASLLDVGCGTGTWMKAASDFGIPEVFGVDGVKTAPELLRVPIEKVGFQDLTHPWNLNKRYDAVLCLEVAEHLDENFAPTLVDALVQHGDLIYFSAACPGQPGQHHVNCQWPAYWQQLFNQRGYVCSDTVRWRIWDTEAVEPWYRQNMFTARLAPPEAGQEQRIPAVLHPQILPWFEAKMSGELFAEHIEQIQNGRMSSGWYWAALVRAFWAKVKRRLK